MVALLLIIALVHVSHAGTDAAGGSRSPSARFDGRTVFWLEDTERRFWVNEPPVPASCRSFDRNSLALTTSPTHSGRRSVCAGSAVRLASPVAGPSTQRVVRQIMTEDVSQLMQYPEFGNRNAQSRFPMDVTNVSYHFSLPVIIFYIWPFAGIFPELFVPPGPS